MDDEANLLRSYNTDKESEPVGRLDNKPKPPPQTHQGDFTCTQRSVQYRKLPVGIWLIEKAGLICFKPLFSYKLMILLLTFIGYSGYHLSRKPFSVVKVVLCPDCANCNYSNESNETGWAPFDDVRIGRGLLGVVDSSYLFSYAIAMFFSGQIADRVNLRYFLFVGMIGSGVTVALLGVAYFAQIHVHWYFIIVQILGGVVQSTGWPGTVAVMGNWFGKHNRGLIMGVWNSHLYVGNILGTIIPSIWADCNGEHQPWGWSFLVPAFIISGIAVIFLVMLVTNPEHVGLPPPKHDIEEITHPSTEHAQSIGTYHKLQPDIDNNKSETVKETDLQNSDNDQFAIQQSEAKKPHPEDGLKEEDRPGERVPPDDNGSEQNPTQQPVDRAAQPRKKQKPKAINFLRAFLIPGVIEYSLVLFFDKLVSYTFLFWLPLYVKDKLSALNGPESDWLSTLFDVGGIIGGILAGVISDQLNARAITCIAFLLLAIPSLFFLEVLAGQSIGWFIILLTLSGLFVNGPYAMITTAVSSDLGTHKSLKNNKKAKATVAAIIDGTGSLGAAFGPLIIGWITNNNDNWVPAFYFLMACCLLAVLVLIRLAFLDLRRLYRKCKSRAWKCSCSCPMLKIRRTRNVLLHEAPAESAIELTPISDDSPS